MLRADVKCWARMYPNKMLYHGMVNQAVRLLLQLCLTLPLFLERVPPEP